MPDEGETEMALEQLSKNKTPGEDLVPIELLKAGRSLISLELSKLFIFFLFTGTSVVVLVFKNGDKSLLKNCRPILFHVYNLFSRVITNRLARKFDDF